MRRPAFALLLASACGGASAAAIAPLDAGDDATAAVDASHEAAPQLEAGPEAAPVDAAEATAPDASVDTSDAGAVDEEPPGFAQGCSSTAGQLTDPAGCHAGEPPYIVGCLPESGPPADAGCIPHVFFQDASCFGAGSCLYCCAIYWPPDGG